MTAPDKGLLDRVIRGIARPGGTTQNKTSGSILAQAATSYGARPIVDAAALFEATVEAVFLVANSDGHFDDDERAAFQSVVSEACNNLVEAKQLDALLADLREGLAEDGVAKRAQMVARTITRRDHQLEVLRIAALMAHISGGVSQQERDVLDHLGRGFDLDISVVDSALRDAAKILAL
jgi:tellurite resistance protein